MVGDLKSCITYIKFELKELHSSVIRLSDAGTKAMDRIKGLSSIHHPNCTDHDACQRIEHVANELISILSSFVHRVNNLVGRIMMHLSDAIDNLLYSE